MPKPDDWSFRLRGESAAWVEEGLIDESQREKIVAKYPRVLTSPPPLPSGQARQASAKSMLPAVLVGLAVLLIGVGMILFYAANWKKMPSAVKFAQVLTMIVLSYGGAFFLLFSKKKWVAAGRGLLILGMLSYGAGIALVVQMYHISAHPARCVLLWAGFVAAMAVVTREKFGLYLALVLVLIWDIWERTIYTSPNYSMILAIGVLFLISVQLKSQIGRFLCVFLSILWFYAVNFHYLTRGQFDDYFALFALMQVPFGIILISVALLIEKKVKDSLAGILRVIGWVAIYTPALLLSWPISFDRPIIPMSGFSQPFLIEYAVLFFVAAILVTFLAVGKMKTWYLLAAGLLIGAALLFIPNHDPGVFMAIMLGALLVFHAFTLLAEQQIEFSGGSVIAVILVLVSVFAHSLGHFLLAVDRENLLVAAGMSGLLFVLAIFFYCLSLSQREESSSPVKVLPAIGVGTGIFILYIASFFSKGQSGVFDIRPDWMIAGLVLAVLALGLGVFVLVSLRANRKLMVGSLVTTVVAIALMVLPGDALPPAFRQLILNALMFLIFGLVIAHAVDINSPALVNLGVVAVVVLVLTRYFDVFWDMLHGSIFFIVTGVVLFSIASLMEWQRRRFMSQIESSADKEGTNS